VLCREFDISRETGYKIFQRYKDCGIVGLTDRSRRPYRYANQLPVQVATLIVRLRREHPSWGAPKIREKLRRLHDDIQTPAMAERPPRTHSPDVEEGSHQAGDPQQQQARFDDFIECYNCDRPHQALDMKYPAELYRPSPGPYQGCVDRLDGFVERSLGRDELVLSEAIVKDLAVASYDLQRGNAKINVDSLVEYPRDSKRL